MYVVYVLNQSGKPLMPTRRFGHVRSIKIDCHAVYLAALRGGFFVVIISSSRWRYRNDKKYLSLKRSRKHSLKCSMKISLKHSRKDSLENLKKDIMLVSSNRFDGET